MLILIQKARFYSVDEFWGKKLPQFIYHLACVFIAVYQHVYRCESACAF